MNTITRKAYAKINIGLDVIRRLENGYHELKMVMQTIDLHDVLTFTPNDSTEIIIQVNDDNIPNNKNNLIYKAADLLLKDTNLGVTITLEKNIPIAAGMAGGSTDAATTFLAVNELFNLGKSQKELMELGVTIGADIPYCIMGGTALSEGIGEILTPLSTAINPYVLIAKPDIFVSTAFVYQNLDLQNIDTHPDIDNLVLAIQENDFNKMTGLMSNVLETVTITNYPIINEIKQLMIDEGATISLMSGSGPTVFGFFENKETLENAYNNLKDNNKIYQIFKSRFK